MKKLITLLILTLSTTAQIKGIVKDSITKQPVGYAAVLIEGTKTGVNTESDGSFFIDYSEKANKLVITALGYQDKTIVLPTNDPIYLAPKINQIEEIKIQNKLARSEIVVGEYKSKNFTFSNGGFKQMLGKLIEYSDEIANHPYIKTLQFSAKSDINGAKIKLRFFEVNNQQQAGDDYLFEDIVVTVKKGRNKNIVDLAKYNIKIPSEGLFIFFESLIIEENKYEYKCTRVDKNNNKTKTICTKYEPSILGAKSNEFKIWSKTDKSSIKVENSKSVPVEIGIKLTLTN
jgi:hypothetical protein